MMTPKQALIKDGTIPVKEGRGRLSREAVERCKYLVAHKGYQIVGYTVEKASASSTPDEPKVIKKTVQPGNLENYAEIVYTFDEKLYKAMTADKRPIGMREVCNNCRVSLVQCHCGRPVIHGDTKVTIVPR